MQSLKYFIPLLFFGSALFAQNGPGGVGASGNNVLWLDANRGVTLSGSSVTNWADQSGNARNAVPSSTASRPTFVSASVNGYPTFDFDGTNDELWVADAAALDLTAWHIFIVPLVDTQKNYNAFLVKGNDSNENYEMLGFSDASMHMPILYTDATRTFPNTTTSQLTSTANIFEYSYSSAVGRDVYRNNNNIQTDNESKTPSTNNFSLYIGNERSTTGRFLDGDLAEVIMYNAILNSAQRIIVNNYLAAKYNCTLTTNDIYVQDSPANGNYDHDVGGIGRVNSSNIQNDSRGSGIVRILNPSGLGDNEFYFWGHDNGNLGTYQTGDYPSGEGLQGRVVRVWRGTEQGTITDFEVRFDLTNMGPVTASHLRLLIDTDNDGSFADETVAGGGVIGSATTLGSNVYGFNNVTGLNNNIRFTIGTTSLSSTPLPIELVDFEAILNDGHVDIKWVTASEKNNSHFTIERSANGLDFEPLSQIKGAINSKSQLNYHETDSKPLPNLSYYRLKQTDLNGKETRFEPVVVLNNIKSTGQLIVSPNPSKGSFTICYKNKEKGNILMVIRDLAGKEYFSKQIYFTGNESENHVDPGFHLPPGTYIITATSDHEFISQKLIVK